MSSSTEAETYQAIVDYIEANGYPPSIRDLGKALGLSSPDTIRDRLLALEDSGMIERVPGQPRAIRLMGKPT